MDEGEKGKIGFAEVAQFLEIQVLCMTTARGPSSKQASRDRWVSGTDELRMLFPCTRCSVTAGEGSLGPGKGSLFLFGCYHWVLFLACWFSLGVGVGFVLLLFFKGYVPSFKVRTIA